MYLFKYILKRIGLMLMTFTIIMIICFVLIKLLGVNIDINLGKDADIIEAQLRMRGYYDPIPVQLYNYVKRLLHGDFGVGVNMYRTKAVWDIFTEKLPATMIVNVYSMIFSVPIGLALGIYAALKKNRWQDHVISTVVMVFISVPSYIYAFLVQYIFCFKLEWFPLTMKSGTDYFSFEMFKSIVPAILALGFGSIAGFARYTRAELTEVLTSDFMLLARTKGLTKPQATVRHALRNAMVPIFPMILGEFIGIMSGSLIIEKIFAIPGVGSLYLTAINVKDYDFFMMLSGFYTLISLTAGIVIDISYGIIDPRIRMGAK